MCLCIKRIYYWQIFIEKQNSVSSQGKRYGMHDVFRNDEYTKYSGPDKQFEQCVTVSSHYIAKIQNFSLERASAD